MKGEIQDKLRNLKVQANDGIVKYTEWVKVDGAYNGRPPCARYGHTMNYLPNIRALVVVGGRNDDLCKGMQIPFLNDIYLYSLDLKSWQ